MNDKFLKIKKFGIYGLAAIGSLAIVFIIFQIVSSGMRTLTTSSNEYYDTGTGGQMMGISAPSPGLELETPLSGFLEKSSNSSDYERISSDEPQQAEEGDLTQRKVIKNGSLSLLVKEAEETAENIKTIAKDLEGFVSESYVYEVSSGVKSGRITIRVPADRFDEAIEKVKGLAVKVEKENVSASDVTEEFIDLEARLKNLKAEEEQYLEIMKRAYTIKDMLDVSQRLSVVRGQVEQIEGQLKYLSRQIDMSSISVSLTSEADVEVFGIRWRPLYIAKQSFRTMLTGLTGYVDTMIRFAFGLPVLLVWLVTLGIAAFAGWKVISRIKRRFFSS